jgi:hypothetical protein
MKLRGFRRRDDVFYDTEGVCMKTYAKRLGIVGLLVAAVLAVASYATIAGGSMQGMDHGTGRAGLRGERPRVHGPRLDE